MTIPEEKTLLDKVLSKLPSDQDWNENIPREAALKEQGESRYLYQANLMVERKLETKEEQVGGQLGFYRQESFGCFQ